MDLVERLDRYGMGWPVHEPTHRKDVADAAHEIRRLRSILYNVGMALAASEDARAAIASGDDE